jgi:hypothetical protein
LESYHSNGKHEIPRDLLGCFLHATVDPKAQSFGKGGGYVCIPEGLRQFSRSSGFKQGALAFDQAGQIGFEVAQEQLVVVTGQQGKDVVIVLLQMLK